jgi:hypothetical protein
MCILPSFILQGCRQDRQQVPSKTGESNGPSGKVFNGPHSGGLIEMDKSISSGKQVDASRENALIPTCIDHDPRAHLRRPMVMMRQG